MTARPPASSVPPTPEQIRQIAVVAAQADPTPEPAPERNDLKVCAGCGRLISPHLSHACAANARPPAPAPSTEPERRSEDLEAALRLDLDAVERLLLHRVEKGRPFPPRTDGNAVRLLLVRLRHAESQSPAAPPVSVDTAQPDETRWRKKPVVIEAMRLAAYTEGLAPAIWNQYEGGRMWRWLDSHGASFRMAQVDPGPAHLLIQTLEGEMRADIGDWIIRGVKGEFYPCKPDIFAATYEPEDH